MTLNIKSHYLKATAKSNRGRTCSTQAQKHEVFSKMKQTREECKSNPEILGLCFDFCQNLPLPNIPIQDKFYMRYLWVNVFAVQNMKTNNSELYTYHEGIARKGANKVCKFLFNYINEFVPNTVKELRLLYDGTSGQNKNHIVIRLCQGLVNTKRF